MARRTVKEDGPHPIDVLVGRRARERRALEGRISRVRGWIKWWNGPMIELTHPEQIEVLAQ